MKLLLIGHSVEDHIFYNGKETVKPGGMYYTTLGMVNIADKNDEIFLATALPEEDENIFGSVYRKIDTSLSVKGKDIVPRVRLDIYDDRERDEKFDKPVQNLHFKLNNPEKFDGILINMISGRDITLEQLDEIRSTCRGTIYMDVHSMTRGFDENLRRPQIILKNFEEWSSKVDIIQVNDNEVYSLFNSRSEVEIASRILESGSKCLIVTKGEKGARIYFRKQGETASFFISAVKVTVNNKVGCGDIFGAVFFHSFIKFGDMFKALILANIAGGIITSYSNTGDLSNLKNDVFAQYYKKEDFSYRG